MSIIDINNLHFQYDKKQEIIKGLNLKVNEGTLLAILGKNGCGKSTLLECILGFNTIKEGKIEICGRNLIDYSEKELAKKIAYISQNTIINMDYTVREFISFGRNPYINFGFSFSKENEDFVYKNAIRCGIEDLLDCDINKISGGERQLAYIARALTQDTPIIIMDEPTASLDFGNQQKLFKLLIELKKLGKTIIFTTHNPNHIFALDCNVAVINNGRIGINGDKTILDLKIVNEIYNSEFGFDGNNYLLNI